MWGVVAGAVVSGEPQLLVRGGEVFAGRLAVLGGAGGLAVPLGGGWRVGVPGAGTVDGVAVEEAGAGGVLGAGEVRIGVRALGVNFRDVLTVLGMYPGQSRVIGAEAAGVVLEAGPGAGHLRAGDRAFGIISPGMGSEAVADARAVARVPGRSFERAASVPVAFLTALYGLRDLAGLRAGSRRRCTRARAGSGWPRSGWPGTGGARRSRRRASPSGARCGRWAWPGTISPRRGPWTSRRRSGRSAAGGGWTWC